MRLIVVYIFLSVSFIVFSSCDKEENTPNPSIEEYLKSSDIRDYSITESGLIYTIDQIGNGAYPTFNDSVTISYEGYLTDGFVFDKSDEQVPFGFVLGTGQVIEGFEEGIKLFQEGGSGTLYIPSELAYGESGRGSIGRNEDLIFEISLLDVDQRGSNVSIEEYLETHDLSDFISTDSGLMYRIVNSGNGTKSDDGATVTVDYEGFHLNGESFDSTYDRDESFTFELGDSNIITGFNEAVALLELNSKGEFLLPYELAYGKYGAAGIIAPFEDIRFEIELLEIK